MEQRLGIAINPDILVLLFRAGAVISGRTFSIRLVEDGIPDDYNLVDCGYNRREGQFFFIFAQENSGPGPIVWKAPIFEREKSHETNPQRP
jgi:hypothetical protein